MTEPNIVRNVVAQPYHVTLSKSAKGTHYWEVSVYGDTPDNLLEDLLEIDRKLKVAYQDEEGRAETREEASH